MYFCGMTDRPTDQLIYYMNFKGWVKGFFPLSNFGTSNFTPLPWSLLKLTWPKCVSKYNNLLRAYASIQTWPQSYFSEYLTWIQKCISFIFFRPSGIQICISNWSSVLNKHDYIQKHNFDMSQKCCNTTYWRNVPNYGSKGKRQWPINWCTSLMMLHIIFTFVDYNYWLKHLNTQLNESTKLLKTLGTSLINRPLSPSFPVPNIVLLNFLLH